MWELREELLGQKMSFPFSFPFPGQAVSKWFMYEDILESVRRTHTTGMEFCSLWTVSHERSVWSRYGVRIWALTGPRTFLLSSSTCLHLLTFIPCPAFLLALLWVAIFLLTFLALPFTMLVIAIPNVSGVGLRLLVMGCLSMAWELKFCWMWMVRPDLLRLCFVCKLNQYWSVSTICELRSYHHSNSCHGPRACWWSCSVGGFAQCFGLNNNWHSFLHRWLLDRCGRNWACGTFVLGGMNDMGWEYFTFVCWGENVGCRNIRLACRLVCIAAEIWLFNMRVLPFCVGIWRLEVMALCWGACYCAMGMKVATESWTFSMLKLLHSFGTWRCILEVLLK